MFVYLLGGSKENKVTYEHCSNQSTGYSPTSFTIIFFLQDNNIYKYVCIWFLFWGRKSYYRTLRFFALILNKDKI